MQDAFGRNAFLEAPLFDTLVDYYEWASGVTAADDEQRYRQACLVRKALSQCFAAFVEPNRISKSFDSYVLQL